MIWGGMGLHLHVFSSCVNATVGGFEAGLDAECCASRAFGYSMGSFIASGLVGLFLQSSEVT